MSLSFAWIAKQAASRFRANTYRSAIRPALFSWISPNRHGSWPVRQSMNRVMHDSVDRDSRRRLDRIADFHAMSRTHIGDVERHGFAVGGYVGGQYLRGFLIVVFRPV